MLAQVHISLNCRPVEISLQFNRVEICAVDIFSAGSCYRFICCYRPPNSGEIYLAEMIDCIRILTDSVSLFFIFGDFNFGDITWSEPSAHANLSAIFLEFLLSEGMAQLIDESTHVAGNTLDLLLVPHPMVVSSYSVGPPLSLSDHYSIIFDVPVPMSISTPKKDI